MKPLARSFATLLGLAILAAPASAIDDPYLFGHTGGVFCSGTSLNACLQFQLSHTGGDDWELYVEYQSSLADAGQSGVLTKAGIYTLGTSSAFDVANVEYETSGGQTWNGHQNVYSGLSGAGSEIFFELAGGSQGSPNGLPVGSWVKIRFTSSGLADYQDDVYARGHLQSYGENECSLKPDSRIGVVDGAEVIDGRCGTTTTVTPEPISMLLFGSGLAGIAGVMRRRREDEIEV